MEKTLEETIKAIRESRNHGYFPEEILDRNLKNKEFNKLLRAKIKVNKNKPFKIKRTIHEEKVKEYTLKVKYLIKDLNNPDSVVLFGNDLYKNNHLLNQFSFPLPLLNPESLKEMPKIHIDNFFKTNPIYLNSLITQRSNFYDFLGLREIHDDKKDLTIPLDDGEIVSNSNLFFLNGDSYLTLHVPLQKNRFYGVFEPVSAKEIDVFHELTGEEASYIKVNDYNSKKQSLIEKTRALVKEMDGFLDIKYVN